MKMQFRFHCYKMIWLKNGKRQVTNLAGAATKKDILQIAKECKVKIFSLIRITNKNEIKNLELAYIRS